MTLKYFIIKGKNKYCSIYIRFWDSKRIDQKSTTGFSVLFGDWSSVKQRLKIKASTENIDFINNKLDKLERYVVDNYNKDYNSNIHISKTWLKEKVSSFFNRVQQDENYKIYFVEWVDKFVQDLPNRTYKGNPIKERTIKNYTSVLNKLKAFEDYKNIKYRFQDIDLIFHRDFINYCKNVADLNPNSTGNLVARIKTFCREIESDGYPINPKYKHRDFSSPKNETFDTYLNDDEINKIFNHDFSDSDRLNNARDLFIIGLRTGLRISDFLRIEKKNILGNVINITTEKTKQNLTIPIHPQFKKTLDKRKGKLPNKISDQKFNLYVKEVCKEAGIIKVTYGSGKDEKTKKKKLGYYPKHKLISSHTCRRSFATGLFLGGVDNSIATKATGHKSEKEYLGYIKASQDEHIKKISEYWEKQTNKTGS
jgi:integrase